MDSDINFWPVAFLPQQECKLEKKEDWAILRRELDHYLRQIDYRMQNQVDYKKTVLEIFAGASYQESKTFETIDPFK